jgi:hypothetical protein
MRCELCPTPRACSLWGCALIVQHPVSIAVPDHAAPIGQGIPTMSETPARPPAPAPAAPPAPAPPRAPRSYVVREVVNGWIAQPCEGSTPGPESVAVEASACAALLRAWCADR